MKKSLLVTIADKGYLNQAKQLFSSVYFNAGWGGDYMLLTSDIAENDLSWFRKRGILVNKKKLLFKNKVGGMSPILTHKFYLFSPEFKGWDIIIYTDCDVIIRGPLDSLKKIKNFNAVTDHQNRIILQQIITKDMLKKRGMDMEKYLLIIKELKRKYNLKKVSFNAGFFAFNSDIIKNNNIVNDLVNSTLKYKKIIKWGEQLPFNLVFYNWQRLSPIYNFYVWNNIKILNVENEKIKSLVIHFLGKLKPWNKKSLFYGEWNDNLKKSESIININKKITIKTYGRLETLLHLLYLNIVIRIKAINYAIDRNIGLIGLFLEKKSPKLYIFLKKIKNWR